MAYQFLKRGVQKVSDDLRGHVQPASERDTRFESPQGVSDDSRQSKSKELKRFGDPVKHSIKEVSEELTGGALLKAALQEYRRRLKTFQERSDMPTESKLRLLESTFSGENSATQRWTKEWIGTLAGESTWRKTKEIEILQLKIFKNLETLFELSV